VTQQWVTQLGDEAQQTYSAREIVLEFFPATRSELIPGERECRMERGAGGRLLIADLKRHEALVFTSVSRAGQAGSQLCCDICQMNVLRGDAELMRAEVPGSQGRRYRYVCVCRNSQACDARRLGDKTLKDLLARVRGR
jgi:hypothetical protein